MSAALHMLRPRHLAWVPAALLAAWAIAAATGFTMTDTSRAATSSSNVSVTASVLPEVHLNYTNCGTDPDGGGPLPYDGNFTPAAMSAGGADTTLASCAMSFGSNNNGTNGASLWIESSRTAGTKSFCAAAFNADCAATNSFTETATAGVALGGDMADGTFGINPTAIANCGGAGADWSTANVYGLPQNTDGTLGTRICDTNSAVDGTTTLAFLADPSGTQAAGNYYVRAILTAQAT